MDELLLPLARADVWRKPTAMTLWNGDETMSLPTSRTNAVMIVLSAGLAIGGFLFLRNGNTLGWSFLLACSFTGALAVLHPVYVRFKRTEHDESIEVTSWGVRRYDRDGGLEALSWDDLAEVSVTTTADIEDGEDVHVRLSGGGHAVRVAHTLAVESGLLAELATRLRAFDNEAMVEALTRGIDSVAVLWSAPRQTSRSRGAKQRHAPESLRAAG